MDADIKEIYNELRGKYYLVLTGAFEQGVNADIDYPILYGTSVLGRFELFYGDLDFEFYAQRADGAFLWHGHLQSKREAEQTVVDFMNGKRTMI